MILKYASLEPDGQARKSTKKSLPRAQALTQKHGLPSSPTYKCQHPTSPFGRPKRTSGLTPAGAELHGGTRKNRNLRLVSMFFQKPGFGLSPGLEENGGLSGFGL
jgi:hypothetical protein